MNLIMELFGQTTAEKWELLNIFNMIDFIKKKKNL